MKTFLKIFAVMLMFTACEHQKSQKLYEPAPGPYSKLVKAGKANAQIVIPASPSYLEEYAALELQKYVESITSAQLPVLKDGETAKHPYTFFIGNTKKAEDAGVQGDAEKMGRDGFEIKTVDKGLIILGRNDPGTLNGVYELLERCFDVRWFMPGEEYVPKSKSLKMGQVNLLYKPSFDIRWVSQGDWALKQRMNAFVKAGNQNAGVNWKWNFHSFYSLMPPYNIMQNILNTLQW
jgi:hypothetical protein